MRKWMIPLIGVSVIALSACGETSAQRTGTGAAGGAVAGAVVGGPVGAVVGAGVGAVAGANREKIDEKTDQAAKETKETVAEASEKVEGKMDGDSASNDSMRSADRVPGPSNADVKDAQMALKDLGLYDGAIDGIYGKKTIRAVNSFQADNDLPKTGTLTERTQTKLQQVASADNMQKDSQKNAGTMQNQGSTTEAAPSSETPNAAPTQTPSEGPSDSSSTGTSQ